MPRPPDLERDVQFWVRVYSQIDTNAGFLHDQANLGVVYDTLHFAPESPPAERQRLIDQARERYEAALRRIAATGDGSLSAEILLRPTIGHPDLSHVLTDDDRRTVHLKLIRDSGRPVDALHVHGHAPREDSRIVEKAIWEQLSFDHGTVLPDMLGQYAPNKRNEALAIAQLLLLWHLLEARG